MVFCTIKTNVIHYWNELIMWMCCVLQEKMSDSVTEKVYINSKFCQVNSSDHTCPHIKFSWKNSTGSVIIYINTLHLVSSSAISFVRLCGILVLTLHFCYGSVKWSRRVHAPGRRNSTIILPRWAEAHQTGWQLHCREQDNVIILYKFSRVNG